MSKIDVDENTSVYSLTYYINSKREHLKERKENFKKAKDSIDCK